MSRGLRTKSADDISPSPRARETHVPAQVVRQRANSPFLCLCSLRVLNEMDEVHTHWGGRSALLILPMQMWIFSGKTHTQPEIMLNETAGNPVAQWSWHIKWTITTSFAETTPGAVFIRMVLAVLSEMANNWRFESHQIVKRRLLSFLLNTQRHLV